MASNRQDEITPDRSGRIAVLAGVSAVGLAVLIGVGVALSGDGAEPSGQELVTVAEAQKLPETTETPRGLETPEADSASGADASALALRMARRLVASQEEAAALEVLDDDARAHGESVEAGQLRAQILASCRELLDAERGTIKKLQAVGQGDLVIEKLARLRGRLPASLHAELDALTKPAGSSGAQASAQPVAGAESEAPSTLDPEAGNPHLATFQMLARNLKSKDNADAHYELGKWAAEHELRHSARRSYQKALELDAFHQKAREALGHTFHEGRWYDPETYKRDVLGLVRGPDGKWAKPDALAKGPEGTRVKKREPITPKPKAGVFVPPPPANPHKEDVAWYRDNEKHCEFDDAPTYTSKYYRIKTNVKPEYAERYGEMMDRYFKRFVSVFKAFLPNKRYSKSEIWIYASKPEFHSATGMRESVGGFYNTQTKRVTAYHGVFGATGNTRTVLVHEGTHQFEDLVLQGKFRNAPIWIIEGLAVFFESARDTGREIKIGEVPGDRLYALKRGIATNSLIPLATLIRTPQQRFGGYHYAHAWGLIYMVLYYGKNDKVRKRCQKWFSDLFAAALDGPVSARDVEAGVGGKPGFRELEEQWKDWIKDLPYDYDPKRN